MRRSFVRAFVITALALFAPAGSISSANEPPTPTDVEVAPAGTTGADRPPVAIRAVDQNVREILAARQVQTRPRSPGVGSYLRDVGMTASRWLSGWIEGLAPELIGVGRWLSGLDPVWFWLALLGLGAWLAVRVLRARPAPSSDRSGSVSAGAEPTVAARPVTAGERVAAIEASLEAGDMPATLEALWWWLAGQLGYATADPSWTSRELVTRAERPDLLPWVRRLDGLIYGPTVPTETAVRGFWQSLRGAFG